MLPGDDGEVGQWEEGRRALTRPTVQGLSFIQMMKSFLNIRRETERNRAKADHQRDNIKGG